MEALKRRPITVSLLLAAVVAVFTVGGFALKAHGDMEGQAAKAVLMHQQQDLDVAHPSTRYTRQLLDDIRAQLSSIREAIARIEAGAASSSVAKSTQANKGAKE